MILAQFGHNLRRSHACLVGLIGREADGSYARVATAAIALAHLGQVHHLCGIGFGPGIGADCNLGAEARLRQADGIHRIGIEVIGNELVEAFERMIGDVEEDGSVALFGSAAVAATRLRMAG